MGRYFLLWQCCLLAAVSCGNWSTIGGNWQQTYSTAPDHKLTSYDVHYVQLDQEILPESQFQVVSDEKSNMYTQYRDEATNSLCLASFTSMGTTRWKGVGCTANDTTLPNLFLYSGGQVVTLHTTAVCKDFSKPTQPAVIRGFDMDTGKLVWTVTTISKACPHTSVWEMHGKIGYLQNDVTPCFFTPSKPSQQHCWATIPKHRTLFDYAGPPVWTESLLVTVGLTPGGAVDIIAFDVKKEAYVWNHASSQGEYSNTSSTALPLIRDHHKPPNTKTEHSVGDWSTRRTPIVIDEYQQLVIFGVGTANYGTTYCLNFAGKQLWYAFNTHDQALWTKQQNYYVQCCATVFLAPDPQTGGEPVKWTLSFSNTIDGILLDTTAEKLYITYHQYEQVATGVGSALMGDVSLTTNFNFLFPHSNSQGTTQPWLINNNGELWFQITAAHTKKKYVLKVTNATPSVKPSMPTDLQSSLTPYYSSVTFQQQPAMGAKTANWTFKCSSGSGHELSCVPEKINSSCIIYHFGPDIKQGETVQIQVGAESYGNITNWSKPASIVVPTGAPGKAFTCPKQFYFSSDNSFSPRETDEWRINFPTNKNAPTFPGDSNVVTFTSPALTCAWKNYEDSSNAPLDLILRTQVEVDYYTTAKFYMKGRLRVDYEGDGHWDETLYYPKEQGEGQNVTAWRRAVSFGPPNSTQIVNALFDGKVSFTPKKSLINGVLQVQVWMTSYVSGVMPAEKMYVVNEAWCFGPTRGGHCFTYQTPFSGIEPQFWNFDQLRCKD